MERNLILLNPRPDTWPSCRLVSLDELKCLLRAALPETVSQWMVRPGIIPLAHLPLDASQPEGNLWQPEAPCSRPAASLSYSKILQGLCQAAGLFSGCQLLLSLAHPGEVVLLFPHTPENAPEIPRQCRELLRRFQEQSGIWLSAGLGPAVQAPERLPEALQAAQKNALSFNLFQEPGGVYTEPDVSGEMRPYNLSAQEDQLYAAILKGSDAAIQEVVWQLSQELFASGFFCLRQLRRLELLYHGMRINWMDKLRIRYPQTEQDLTPPAFYFSTGFNARGFFSPDQFREGLCRDLYQVSRFYRLLSGKQDAGPRFFAQIKEYIDFSYAHPLSQQKIADQFYVSVSYLSHAFKKVYGVGMTQYINQVRLEKAKELLIHSSLSVNEIARQTGFRDEKYFSRLFHQTVGCPPSQYRSQAGSGSPLSLS